MSENYAYYLNPEKSNFNFIRLVCALMIIYGHSMSLILPDKIIGSGDFIHSIFGYYSAFIGVKTFFFLSGLLVINSLLNYKDLWIYAIKRFFRIYPALIFVILVSAFVIGPLCTNLSWTDYFTNSATWQYISKNLTFHTWGNPNIILPGVFEHNHYPMAVNAPLWAITAECFAYVLIFALFATCAFNKTVATVVFSLVILDFLLPKQILFYWIPASDSNFGAIPFCYALGGLIALHKDKIKIDWFVALGLIILAKIFKGSFVTDALQLMSIFAVIMCIAKTKIITHLPKFPDLSYGIFLFGWPVQQAICSWFPRMNYFANIGFTILIAAGFAWISLKFIEKPTSVLENKVLIAYKKRKNKC